MPPVIAWVATAVVTATGVSMAAATWVATLLVNGAVMFAAQKLLGKKPNMGEFMSDVADRTQMVRQSTQPRRLIYGRCKVSGNMVYAKETGTKREYLHMAIVLASHECDSILDIYVNDELVEMNGNVPVATSKYFGFLRINKHLGTAAQTADADLVAECGPEWTNDHRLRGHTYLAVRVKYDETVFPSGLPVIAAVPRGMKITDPRDAVTRWTSNVALCVYHYMQSRYGLGVPDAEWDLPSIIAAANVCDEDVGLATSFTRQCDIASGNRHIGLTTQTLDQMDGIQPGMKVSGTGIPAGAVIVSINVEGGAYFFTIDRDPPDEDHSNVPVLFGDTEKRYTLNGTVDTSTGAGDVIEAMLSAMAGKVVYAGGKWFMYAGAYQTPTVSLSEDDCRGPIQVTTKLSRRELANYVKGVYVSEADGWVATDAPQYAPALYLTEDDNEPLPRDIQLPYTTSSSTAQRLFKIELERIRQQIITRWPCKLSALKVQCGDNVMLNNEREGWVNKVFEVVSFILVPYRDDRGNPAIGVDLVLRETASGVWDWADGAETVTDLAPNTTLHDPFDISEPTALTLLSDQTTGWLNGDGVFVPRLKASWTAPADQYVLSGGKIRVQYKKHSSAIWLEWTQPLGDQVEEFISDVESGDAYDVRIRSETRRGIVSDWVDSLTAYPAGYTIPGDVVACDSVSGGVVTGLPESIRISWTLPDITVEPNTDLDFVELYEAGSFAPPVLATAATFRAGKENTYLRSNVSAGATGYYWGRTVDKSRNKSAWVYLGTATAQNGVGYAVGLANAAQSTANTAYTTANGKNTVFRQTAAPTANATNDIWIDTDDDNKVWSWNGSAWEERFVPFLRLDGNNNVSGLIKIGGVSKDFVLVADKFQVWNGTSAQVPFEIVGGVVYIKESFIQYLTADKISAGSIAAAISLTTGGSFSAGSGANKVEITPSGMTIGDTTGRHIKLKGGVSGYSSVEFYNGVTMLGGMGLEAGSGAVYVQGTTGNSLSTIGGFDTANLQNLKALSTSDPETTDDPLYTGGGAWIAKTLHCRGVGKFNSHIELASTNRFKFTNDGSGASYLAEDWGVNLWGDGTHPVHIRGSSLVRGGSGGTNYGSGNMYGFGIELSPSHGLPNSLITDVDSGGDYAFSNYIKIRANGSSIWIPYLTSAP